MDRSLSATVAFVLLVLLPLPGCDLSIDTPPLDAPRLQAKWSVTPQTRTLRILALPAGLLTVTEEERITLRSAADGSLVWQSEVQPRSTRFYEEVANLSYVFVSLVAEADPGRPVELVAYDSATGETAWSRPYGEAHERYPIQLYGATNDRLIVGSIHGVAFLSAQTGEQIARVTFDSDEGFYNKMDSFKTTSFS